MVNLLQGHLAREGWATTAATSGADALSALERDDYDAVLTDLVMDEVDGQALRLGAHDYLTKPFRMEQASVAVRRAIDDRRLREEHRRPKNAIVEQLCGRNGGQGRD